MNIALIGLSVWLTAVDLPAGTELQYSGTLSHQAKGESAEVKSFTLYALTVTAEDGHPQLAWYSDERGGGSWGWPERLGSLPLAEAAIPKSASIRLLYAHEGQRYPLLVRLPIVEFRDKLTPQNSWTDGRHQYAVTRQRKVKDRDCVQVEVSSNLGRYQTLVIETATGILMLLDERVIIGRGDEFQLKMELQSQNRLSDADLAKSRRALDSLFALHTRLGRTGDQQVLELTPDQAMLIQNDLPKIEQESQGTFWSKVTAAISRDVKIQQKRLEGIAGIQKKLVGQPQPEWKLKLTDGTAVSDQDLQGKVVILHFWQYRSEPLNEPYGQIGYLDFLYSKRKKLGVRVIGVNVDERYSNPQQTAAANRSMRGLLEFMRLSYDMATDNGTVLAEFGDPRSLGAPLPLWVVIGHDGKVAHYHTGIYDIKPDEGLKELDEAVIEAVRRQNGK